MTRFYSRQYNEKKRRDYQFLMRILNLQTEFQNNLYKKRCDVKHRKISKKQLLSNYNLKFDFLIFFYWYYEDNFLNLKKYIFNKFL